MGQQTRWAPVIEEGADTQPAPCLQETQQTGLFAAGSGACRTRGGHGHLTHTSDRTCCSTCNRPGAVRHGKDRASHVARAPSEPCSASDQPSCDTAALECSVEMWMHTAVRESVSSSCRRKARKVERSRVACALMGSARKRELKQLQHNEAEVRELQQLLKSSWRTCSGVRSVWPQLQDQFHKQKGSRIRIRGLPASGTPGVDTRVSIAATLTHSMIQLLSPPRFTGFQPVTSSLSCTHHISHGSSG